MCYSFISKAKQSFHTAFDRSACFEFNFDLVLPFYFLKWDRYFSTFLPVLARLIYPFITVGSMN